MEDNTNSVLCLSNTDDFRKKLISRINRIAGQLRGIEKMILNQVKCDEILNQVSSVKSALNGVAKVVLEAHLKNCVVYDIKAGLEEEATTELIITLNALIEKKGKKINRSNNDIIRKIEKQIESMRKSVEKDDCCSSILRDISIIKDELDSMAKVILAGHVKRCLVRDIKSGLEEKTIDDFLYTINKMMK
ncbi:metal-sensing transcriptional repressor [Fusobacterium sp.]|uniref:metal-sensing transcriptional repressor n=1 Tax=Fusobacterium sp. TaxID=68766 RepID=UPI0025C1B085|nr:metal-sensing transcriptional repressor [Fusobacterium sp.]